MRKAQSDVVRLLAKLCLSDAQTRVNATVLSRPEDERHVDFNSHERLGALLGFSNAEAVRASHTLDTCAFPVAIDLVRFFVR
jgi:hypothetical protein